METSDQKTPSPQYHQTVVIVGKQKSAGVAFILAFFFGPLGLLYASVTGGIVMFIFGVLISIITLGLGLVVVWIACIIWAVIAVNNTNSKASSGPVAINTGAQSSQSPQQTATQPVNHTVPPPVVQQSSQSQESYPKPLENQQTEVKTNDFSLNGFSEWVNNNKRGLIFGVAGVVLILVLAVAVKFVISLDFNKQRQNNSVSTVGMDSTKIDTAKISNISIIYNGLYPQSSSRLLTSSDLSNLTKRDLKIMRNEVFARHGYIFKTFDMRHYFSQQNWYRPIYNDVTDQLSDIEKNNVELIKSYEK